MNKRKVILITGGGTGLGKIIAQHLLSQGHVVYSGSRKNTSETAGIKHVQLDITSDIQVKNALSQIVRKEKSIDVIINNAGVTLSGPTLNFSVEDFKNILETNVIGSFRLIKTASELSKKPSLIINITSLNAFLALPNFGLYCASKFAAEALGLALRYELGPKIQIVNVAPGALFFESKNKISHKTAREKFPLLNWIMPLTYPSDVAIAINKLLNSQTVPARVLVGRDAKIINLMQKLLPFSVFDRIVFYIWKKK